MNIVKRDDSTPPISVPNWMLS